MSKICFFKVFQVYLYFHVVKWKLITKKAQKMCLYDSTGVSFLLFSLKIRTEIVGLAKKRGKHFKIWILDDL